MQNKNIIVKEIAGNRAVLESNDEQQQTKLEAIGFVRDGGRLIRPVVDDADRKYLIIKLINMNALFSSGRDWSPEELLDYYSEKGIINQPYQVISWSDKTNFEIITKGSMK